MVGRVFEIGQQSVKGVGNMLGNGAHLGQHGHEVVVAVPARHDVPVEMGGDSRACGLALVEADVEAVRGQMGAKNGNTFLHNPHDCATFFFIKIGDVGHVSGRGHQQMAVGVREAVHQHRNRFVPVEEQALPCRGAFRCQGRTGSRACVPLFPPRSPSATVSRGSCSSSHLMDRTAQGFAVDLDDAVGGRRAVTAGGKKLPGFR